MASKKKKGPKPTFISFTNFLATYLWVGLGIIFISTGIFLTKLRIRGEKTAINFFAIFNFVFAGIAFAGFIFIVFFTFIFKRRIPSFVSGFLNNPPSIYAAVIAGLILLFASAVFIGNTIFLGRIKRDLESGNNEYSASIGATTAFWAINIVLSIITPIIGLSYIFFIYLIFEKDIDSLFATSDDGKGSKKVNDKKEEEFIDDKKNNVEDVEDEGFVVI